MATENLLDDGRYELRFYLTSPLGGVIDRRKTVEGKDLSYMRSLAGVAESKTKQGRHTEADIDSWVSEGLIKRKVGDTLLQRENIDISLGRAFEIYLNALADEPDKYKKARLNLMLDFIGSSTPIRLVTSRQGIDLRDYLKKRHVVFHRGSDKVRQVGLSADHVNRYLEEMRSVFTYHRDIGHITTNPFNVKSVPPYNLKKKKYKVEKRESIAITFPDVEKVLGYARWADLKPGNLKSLAGKSFLWFLFMFGTGTRRMETLRIRFENIDWEKRECFLPGEYTKTGEPRHIGLGKLLYDELRNLKLQGGEQKHNGFVFKQFRPSYTYRPLKKLLTEAGFPDMVPHDCRHTFTTRSQDDGIIKVPMEIIREKVANETGHLTDDMLDNYTHYFERDIYQDRFPFMQKEIGYYNSWTPDTVTPIR